MFSSKILQRRFLSLSQVQLRPHFSVKKQQNNTASDVQSVQPNVTNSSVVGYTPSQIRTAYGLNKIPQLDGTGITVGIIDAYVNPNLLADFQFFDAKFNIGNPTALTIYNMATGIPTNQGWGLEQATDTQMIHAILPKAKIYQIVAKTSNLTDLIAAVQKAVSLNVNVISMSFGSAEFPTQTIYDNYLSANNICFLGSSGDTGGICSWPSTSSKVLSVGGSSLQLNANGSRISETGWSGSGGGSSAYVALPSFQAGVISGTKRQTPDVSMCADPNFGVAVYDSFGYENQSGWFEIGGTSVSCALWAGVVGLMQQQRNMLNKALLNTNQLQTCLYQYIYSQNKTTLYPLDIFEILTGQAGTFQAGPGYNNVCGLGTCDCAPTVNSSSPPPVTILSGNGAPLNTLGSNGNYYIDISTGNYYLNTNGVWSLQGNIIPQTSGSQGSSQGLVIDVSKNA